MGISIAQLLVILLIILVLFGAGRLPQVMSELGKGIKAFRDSLNTNNNDHNNSDKKLDNSSNNNDKDIKS